MNLTVNRRDHDSVGATCVAFQWDFGVDSFVKSLLFVSLLAAWWYQRCWSLVSRYIIHYLSP